MVRIVVLLVCAVASGQTFLEPNALNRASEIGIRPDFFSHCANGSSAYLGTVRGNQAEMRQVRHYGLWIDGKILNLWRPSEGPLSITMRSAVSGSIALRYALQTPNFNLIGIELADVRISGGGWAMSSAGRFSGPALAKVKVLNGEFVSIDAHAHATACDSYRDIRE